MRKIMVVVLLVRQLQHGFTKNAKVSPNLTVALLHHTFFTVVYYCLFQNESQKHVCNRAVENIQQIAKLIQEPKLHTKKLSPKNFHQ